MDFEIVYPTAARRSVFLRRLRYICGWVFLAAAAACPIVNYFTGRPWWSPVAVWGMYMVWTLVLQQPLVERNLIGQGVKLLVTTGILMVLVEFLLSPGWAHTVIPIFIFSSLIALGTLFFVNVRKQRHNVMSLILVTVLSFIGSAVALWAFSDTSWPMIVLCVVAAALFAASVITLRFQLLRELRRRFHTK